MRILVHDYIGHAFPLQLSRALANRHHQVLHLYAGYFQTPRGRVDRMDSDPENFNCVPLYLKKPFAKYFFIKRWFQEIEYGKVLSREVERFQPEAVISANTPLDPQNLALKKCKEQKIKFIFWLQDLYGTAVKNILSKKYSILGKQIGLYYEKLETSLLRQSDHIVLISEDFLHFFEGKDIPRDRIRVIHNWAPLEELPLQPKDNKWSRAQGLHDKLCLLYSGTMGLKHNPELILDLAVALKDRNDVRIVVISEGLGASFLQQKKGELGLENIIILNFQPFEVLPQIMGAADILLAILEEDAGIFSVPSKVLTYHCAGRPLLLAVPINNLAAKIVKENETGIVVAPDDAPGFVEAAEQLLHDRALRQYNGAQARKYAERTFDIDKITGKFEEIFFALS